ncbi:polyprenyl synthetase family protein [Sanguibacter sp. A247]|uniref:polyprenyl synthetase family protein n=1 Tax=unclassified Sanguibacter TaxID=2645534 RepID=UPI003FD6F5F6
MTSSTTPTAGVGLPVPDPELAQLLADRLETVESVLRESVTQTDQLADDASRHLVDAGGKRLRPLLALLCAELGDGSRPEVVDAAVVVELTHLATLYHDDVMDSAPLRRGAPSAHEVWGNSVAILTGDLLFARASGLVAGLGTEAVKIQAATFERLCLGQMRESVGPRESDDAVEHYIGVLADKTASLLATSALFGARFAGCSLEVAQMVAAYGERLGVAFQLADDVLDLTSSGELSGKTPGTDLREKVPTMPTILLRRRVASGEGTADDADLVALLDSDLSDDAVLAEALGRLRDHEVVGATRELAAQWARDAVAEIVDLSDGRVKETLVAFADAMVDRAT